MRDQRRAVYEYLMKEGVVVVKKDAYLPKHQHITEVPNLIVQMIVKSLKSKGYLDEVFNWQWSYYFLNEQGVKFLVRSLGLKADVVPETYRKTRMTKPAGEGKGKGEEGEEEEDQVEKEKAEAKAAAE